VQISKKDLIAKNEKNASKGELAAQSSQHAAQGQDRGPCARRRLPDNDVTRDIDNRRILWAAEDIIRNRPALSRWHPDYKDEFATFLASESPFRR
jgi:hypothetical protein